jgi:hypothetical protein
MSTANTAGLLQFLWGTIDRIKASDEELAFLSEAATEASNMARSLSDTVSGVGCLIAEDQHEGMKSGALQDGAIPGFLFGISDQLNTIAEMAFIGNEAGFLLSKRRAAKAKAASRRVRSAEDSSGGGE